MYDRAEILVRAGDGGDGVVSFRKERFVPYGGPDGGDGGDGGDIIIRADSALDGLREYTYKHHYRAQDGRRGMGNKKYGRKGEDLFLPVPIGTIILERTDAAESPVLADLIEEGQQVIVAKGGEGGRGNVHFASSTNQVPLLAQKGGRGEEKSLLLELKLLADAGIIGYPNAGKSTLLSAISAARPKIADYPFTTLGPVLGVAEVGQQTFIVTEIPGIVDGAHLGRGLGHDFLKHVVRTRLLIHLVDGSAVDPAENVAKVTMELTLFDSTLGRKPQIIVVNKMDLPEVKVRQDEIRRDFKAVGISPFFISASTGEGVSALLEETAKLLRSLVPAPEAIGETEKKIFRPQPRMRSHLIQKKEGAFLVLSPGIERIVAGSAISDAEVIRQLMGLLAKAGVSRALEKAGVKPGDTVRCGILEWKW